NNLTHCGSFRIYIHPVTRFQMSNNSFSRDLKRNSNQFRVTTRLDVINSQEPFIQRQMRIKSHDYVKPSNQNFGIKMVMKLRCNAYPLGLLSTQCPSRQSLSLLGLRTPKQ